MATAVGPGEPDADMAAAGGSAQFRKGQPLEGVVPRLNGTLGAADVPCEGATLDRTGQSRERLVPRFIDDVQVVKHVGGPGREPPGLGRAVAAGAAGAPARYLLDRAIAEAAGAFPWGTFVINISGSFLFGSLTGLGLNHAFPKVPRVVLGTGFCGAYTTFSTFTFETVRLLEEGVAAEALRYTVGSLLAGSFAAAAGLAVAAI